MKEFLRAHTGHTRRLSAFTVTSSPSINHDYSVGNVRRARTNTHTHRRSLSAPRHSAFPEFSPGSSSQTTNDHPIYTVLCIVYIHIYVYRIHERLPTAFRLWYYTSGCVNRPRAWKALLHDYEKVIYLFQLLKIIFQLCHLNFIIIHTYIFKHMLCAWGFKFIFSWHLPSIIPFFFFNFVSFSRWDDPE